MSSFYRFIKCQLPIWIDQLLTNTGMIAAFIDDGSFITLHFSAGDQRYLRVCCWLLRCISTVQLASCVIYDLPLRFSNLSCCSQLFSTYQTNIGAKLWIQDVMVQYQIGGGALFTQIYLHKNILNV